ncbi:TonB-dependent receptor [Sphingomonas sp. AOB5]|uniref:TonB-dependent receptor domain-containing protein n=1 Tax=Sphingomonas sp. AOB5 TaxID=3034017 RepID=UPI0023F67A13|nr:TonB-dependent receptor [Sphingomonas sp. AOB5]MDF7774891.1 TonB-dependent receptor [Sphingomonas sp. AOB5]
MTRGITRLSVAAIALIAAVPALAQRTDDNAVAEAEDAFGTSVGDDSIGIYNAYNVRAFSPVDAGNVRIEGLYFDQQTYLTSRVIAGSTIRVGISAQSYSFPAPTGIADFSLRKPGGSPLASVGVGFGPWNGGYGEVDFELPIDGERLGIAAGAGIYRNGQPFGGSPKDLSMGTVVRYAPRPGIELMTFWSRVQTSDAEAQPLIFTSGAFLPKRFARNEFYGQEWADYGAEQVNYGMVARADPAGFDVRLGVFRSVSNVDRSAADLLFNTGPDGLVGRRIVVIEQGASSASTSGELRVSRHFDEGPRRHTFIASARGRAQDRRYGGAALIDLGPSTSLGPDFRPEPAYAQGPQTTDAVRQTTFGLAYQGRWRSVGELSLGIQKSDYSKTVTDPNPLVVFPKTEDSPFLFSANAAVYVTPKLAFYGGYTRGLEESPVAPIEAVNLNEAPPAIRTRQMDGGLRWTVGKVHAVVGVFDVEKPYFNLDSALRFRQLGMVRHRGVEISVAGELLPGLYVVAGNIFLDARVSGEEVANGTIGPKPVGSIGRHTIVSFDYRLPSHPALSFDIYAEGTSDRTANAANTLIIPTRAILNLGTRYRFNLGDTKLMFRAQVANVTNTFGWNNGGSGFFVPNGARRFSLSLAADI